MKPKAVALISGGIDSPVAVSMMAKKYDIILVHLDNKPYAPKMVEKKVRLLTDRLRKVTKQKLPLYIVPHGPNLKRFLLIKDRKLICVMCRRMMYRVANEIAKENGAKAIITGESLAQVASQTLQNLTVENSVSDLPILRPLIGFDKDEITKIAKKIGTYEISIMKEKACSTSSTRALCCYATPEYPATRAASEEVEFEEKDIEINKLVKESIDNSKKH
jgi:thiamine biosynthesis protein ThiI